MKVDMNKIGKARTSYVVGMILMVVAGYALISCGVSLFQITDHFPAVPLAVSAVLLLAYNLGVAWLYIRLVKSQQNSLVNFYLASRIIRMVFSIMVLVVLGLIIKEGVTSLVLSYFVLYIITMVYESVFFVQIEKRINEKQNK